MKNEVTDNQSTEPLKTSRQYEAENPISAINKLKSVNNNIEMMKNRYLVLRRRDDYNKYKTLDQEKKINLHQMIHDRLQNEREELRKSLQEVRETKTIKERTQSIRKQILDGITTAKKSHLNNNLQKYEQVIEESTKNKETIESNKETDLSLNRSRTLGLKKLEEQEKEMIQKKLQERRAKILASKSHDSTELKQKSTQGEQLIQKLQKDEIELINETSKSIEHSRLMSQKYTKIMMNLPTYRNKRSQSSQRSSFLPPLKQKNGSNNNTLHVIVV